LRLTLAINVTANSELRAGAVKARSRVHSAVGAQRRGLDGAEHSSTIVCVMAAGAQTAQSSDPVAGHLLPEKHAQLSADNRHASRNVNDPSREVRGATHRARHRGRSRSGLLSTARASFLTGGTQRRPAIERHTRNDLSAKGVNGADV